jgi:L-alanine-DL-glutamate epimerase-like enolase superfamily enzyme
VELKLEFIELALKVPWKLSRNTSLTKTNGILTLICDSGIFYSEIAPNIRYHESVEKIKSEILEFKQMIMTTNFFEALDLCPLSNSTRFALEALWIQMMAQNNDQQIYEYLGIEKPRAMATSFSLPIMEVSEIEKYLKDVSRFHFLKIKINQENAWDLVSEVVKFSKVPLRIDGNETFTDLDSYMRFEEKLVDHKINVEFMEEPFAASETDMYRRLKKVTKFKIMADESIQNTDNLEELSSLFHAVNIKLMKTGSIFRARDFLIKAKELKLQTMLGCMIETSLGISFAMELNSLADVIDLDGFLLIKEDPYKLVLEEDGILKLKN